MSGILVHAAADTQTALVSLGAAVAGSTSEVIGNYLVGATVGNGVAVGDVGLSFLIRAVTSSVVLNFSTGMMPDTSGNILFVLIFYGANASVIRDAVTIGKYVVSAATSATRSIGTGPARGDDPLRDEPSMGPRSRGIPHSTRDQPSMDPRSRAMPTYNDVTSGKCGSGNCY